MMDKPQVSPPSARRAIGIVLGAGAAMYVNLGPVLIYTFGVFIKPIAAQTGWDRAAVAASFGPATLAVGLIGPLGGHLLDRYGPRRFIGLSSVGFALGLAALGQASSSASTFSVLLLLAMILGSGLTPVPCSYVVSSWFKARRGLALGLALSFGGIAIATLPPLSAALIERIGWRQAYAALACMVFILGGLVAPALIRDPQEAQAESVAYGATLKQALATRTFWELALSLFLITFAVGAGTVHLPALLSDRGVEPTRAAFIMTVVGITMLLGRVMVGALLDRFSAQRVASLVFLGPAAGHALLAAGASGGAAVLAAALFGIGLGAELDVFPYLAARFFGLRHFGKIYGSLMIAFSAGLAAGPSLVGSLLGRTGRYDEALWISAVAALAAAVLSARSARAIAAEAVSR